MMTDWERQYKMAKLSAVVHCLRSNLITCSVYQSVQVAYFL